MKVSTLRVVIACCFPVLGAGGLPVSAQDRDPPARELVLATMHVERFRIADQSHFLSAIRVLRDPEHVALGLRAVGRIGDPSLVGIAARWLAVDEIPWEDARVAEAAAVTVGLLADPSLLVPLAGRVDAEHTALALAGVGRMPAGEEERAALRKHLGLHGEPSAEVFTRLARVAELEGESARAAGWLRTANDHPLVIERRRAGAYWFARHPRAVLPEALAARVLVSCLEDVRDPETLLHVLRALGRMDTMGAGLAEFLPLIANMPAQDPGVRAAALELIGRRAPAGAVPLGRIARWLVDVNPIVRAGATRALARVSATEEELEEALLAREGDRSGMVRLAAGEMRAKHLPDAILKRRAHWRLSSDWSVLVGLGGGLFRAGAPGNRSTLAPLLVDLVKHPDRRVRLATLDGLIAAPAALRLPILAALMEAGGGGPGLVPGDPILCGQLLRFLLKVKELEAAPDDPNPPQIELTAWIVALMDRIPSSDLEGTQAVIDATRLLDEDSATARLERIITSEEVGVLRSALVTQALDVLKERDASLHARLQNTLVDLRRKFIDDREVFWRELQESGRRLEEMFAAKVREATIHTTGGDLRIRLFVSEAPRTVANFERLAQAGWYEGIRFHRVVPNFVVQAGCPRGDGWGGPHHTIPCEINARPYRRGSLGMALAGKDTGGSQWFLCHRPQPHLDLRYTVFGELAGARSFEVLDAITTDDTILGVTFR